MIPYSPADPLSDFRNFLTAAYQYLGIKKPTKRQLHIAYYMQYGPQRKVVEAFRGIGKSWVAAAFAMWVLYHRPGFNIMVVSASKQRADNFTTFCMRLMTEVPFLQHLRPTEAQRNSKVMFDVAPAPPSQSPSLYSVGITGQITGNRADLIIADDVEVPNNSATTAMREKLGESIKEFDAVLKPGGHVLYLGTPQTEESIYNLLPSRGYTIRVWPARYPDEQQRLKYGDRLAPDITADLLAKPSLVGHTTEPERFTDMDLAEREASYGRAGFALQYMLDTRLADMDRYPLKLSDLLVMDLDAKEGPERCIWSSAPEYEYKNLPVVGFEGDRYYRPVALPNLAYREYTGIVMSIDPSGRGRDETAYAVVAYLHGMLFLLDAGAVDGYTDASLRRLAEVAKRWQVRHVIAEANFGDGMFTKILQPVMQSVYPVTIEEVKHHRQKEARIIDTIEPVTSGHKLVVNQRLIEEDYNSVLSRPSDEGYRYRLFYQFSHITREKGSLDHDDRLDALSIAIAYWVEHMARDTQKAAEKAREKELMKELKNFAKYALGKELPKKKGGWMKRRLGA